jgi:hypothetical protein
MKQCTQLVCKETFSFKVNGKGRTITFKKGQEFWTTSTAVYVSSTSTVAVARKEVINSYIFSVEEINKFFDIRED